MDKAQSMLNWTIIIIIKIVHEVQERQKDRQT